VKMPRGKHKGQDLADVPDSYLSWVLREATSCDAVLYEAIRARQGPRRAPRHLPPYVDESPPRSGWVHSSNESSQSDERLPARSNVPQSPETRRPVMSDPNRTEVCPWES
jgi:hypothetical protein